MKLYNKSGPAIFCLDCLGVFSGLIVLILFIQVMVGCSNARRWAKADGCDTNSVAKIEYVFFGYRLGCWMGQ